VSYLRKTIDRPGQWQYGKKDDMPYGDAVYDFNETLVTEWEPGIYDIIPRYKNVLLTGGESTIKSLTFIDNDPEAAPESYHISVHNDSLTITCHPERQWAVYLPFQIKVMGGQDRGAVLPNVEIDNAPDMAWRGLMIDISRNYQSPRILKKIMVLMAANGLNKLHLHFADDEAWRLEIPGLPELTQIGSRRGYYAPGTESDALFLPQIFCGNGDPANSEGTANGHYTRADFIDLLKFGHALGIDILPEIESPGHARAAIRAMEHRYKRSGNDKYRLIHDGDTSTYTSAQSFHDNVMNPALTGPYNFMEKVFDEIIAMYKDAGVPLTGIHIGGDEVPRGAWNGSEKAREFMNEKGLKTQNELHAYFVERMAEMLSKRNVKMHGWQEVALGHSEAFNDKVRKTMGGVNCWSTLTSHNNASVTDRAVTAGYPTILSNVNHLYFDLAYSAHPEEKGLTWGGYVDEFASFDAYRSKLCPASDSVPGVTGLNANVFAETMRSPSQLYSYLLPKIFGLAERAWNNDTTYSVAQYNAIIGQKELPFYSREDVNMQVHMRQPGIKIIDGKVNMNSPYGIPGTDINDAYTNTKGGGVIVYTLDGNEPTEKSAIYRGTFDLPADTKVIKARLMRNKTQSVTTYLYINERQ